MVSPQSFLLQLHAFKPGFKTLLLPTFFISEDDELILELPELGLSLA
jgi:hypothetical protein